MSTNCIEYYVCSINYVKIGVLCTFLESLIGAFIYIAIMFLFKNVFICEGINIIKLKFLKSKEK